MTAQEVAKNIQEKVARNRATYIEHRKRYEHDETEYVVFAENEQEYISYVYSTVGGGLFAGVYQFKTDKTKEEAYADYLAR